MDGRPDLSPPLVNPKHRLLSKPCVSKCKTWLEDVVPSQSPVQCSHCQNAAGSSLDPRDDAGFIHLYAESNETNKFTRVDYVRIGAGIVHTHTQVLK